MGADGGLKGVYTVFSITMQTKLVLKHLLLTRTGGGGIRGGGVVDGGLKGGLHSLFYDHAEDIGTSTLGAYTYRGGEHSRRGGLDGGLKGGLHSLFYDHAEEIGT